MIDVTVGGDYQEHQKPLSDNPQNQAAGYTKPTKEPLVEINQENIAQDPLFKTKQTSKKSSFLAIVVFSIFILVYIILSLASLNEKYVDFGDGNYLYISWRLTEGDILYKDLPSPQPPLLLFLGAFWLWLGGGDVSLLRIWQIVIHALTACCIWGISQRVFRWPALSSLAGIIYLYLPIGVWWATGYQSEPILVLLQTFNVMLFLDAVKKERPSMTLIACGIIAVLTAFTNMTALPYILLQWFFVAYQFRPLLLRYSLTVIITGIVGLIGMYIYSDGQYFYHVFARQVGTYPAESFEQTLSYVVSKLINEGRDILVFEGGFIVAALLGILLYSGDKRFRNSITDYVVWWAIFAIGSVIFVSKGGTVDYIFTIGEPAVAVFSAYLFITLFIAADIGKHIRGWFNSALQFGKFTLIVCLLLPALLMMPMVMLNWVFTNSARLFELSDFSMKKSTAYIHRNVEPDEEMIGPPYYAFHAKRKLAGNTSSLFILAHAYFNEYKQLVQQENLDLNLPLLSELNPSNPAQPYFIGSVDFTTQHVYDLAELFEQRPELAEQYPAVDLFLEVREQMMAGEVPVVYANVRHLFFAIPPLQQAIRDFYTPAEFSFSQTGTFENRNREELIMVYEYKNN